MPTAVLVADTATGIAVPTYSLWLGGLDVLPAHARLDSIRVKEAGPGAISSMDFELWDPPASITVADGTEVQFWNNTANVPLFRGHVDGWSSSPAFATGRIMSVSCVGVEAWLDWLTFVPDSVTLFAPVESLARNIENKLAGRSGPLSVVRQTGGTNGTLGAGLSSRLGAAAIAGDFVLGSEPLPAGPTLRQTITTMIGLAQNGTGAYEGDAVSVLVTVDFHLGLRAWSNGDPHAGTLFQPDDYTTLTVSDTPAGAIASSQLDYTVELGDVVHEVYIEGDPAAPGGPIDRWFSDGTGIRGRQGFISDTAIDSAQAARFAAATFLAEHSTALRGTLTVQQLTAPTTVHAGSLLALTDAAAGATGTYRIFSIEKTFNPGGTQNWKVAFGGQEPSAIRLVRKLTRDVPV